MKQDREQTGSVVLVPYLPLCWWEGGRLFPAPAALFLFNSGLRSEEERKSATYDELLGHHLVMLVFHRGFPEWHAGWWDITIMTL